jgi:hypothetical protein
MHVSVIGLTVQASGGRASRAGDYQGDAAKQE